MNESEQEELEKIKKECLAYFGQSPVWKKVLRGFREKYSSYGRFGGKVVLKNLKSQDIEELEGFFGKSFHGQKSVTVSAEKFRQALEVSRYKNMTPEWLLENFFEEPLLGKQEQKLLRQQEKERIWENFRKSYEGMPIETVEESLENIVKDSENRELTEWERLLRLGAEMYNHLPYRQNEKLYLAVFAAMLTGNPHAFDNGTADGNFLYQIIQMDMESRSIKIEASEIFPAYKRQKSYLMAGIMLDDISNYAMLYQVQAVKKDGSIHQGMAGFAREQHIVQVPLAKSGTKVYYAGDLDPEGILIAQKLSRYYKGEFHYWYMETEDYEKCKSEEVISPKRMKILERITDDRLKPVVERIKAYGTAGYQEMLMEETK